MDSKNKVENGKWKVEKDEQCYLEIELKIWLKEAKISMYRFLNYFLVYA